VVRAAVLAGVAATLALGVQFAPPAVPKAPPDPGTLHFDAHWRLIPVGHATLAWSEAGGRPQITFTADSIGVVNLFYPVHDRMRARYDPATFCAEQANNDVAEGRRHHVTEIAYHPGQHELVLDENDLTRSPSASKHEVKPIPGCVLDLFTALDYVRAQPLHMGDTYTFAVNEGGKTSQVRARVDLRETVSTPAGRFSCVRVTPTVEDPAALNNPGRMWVWFTDDARHLPVQIEARVSWGTLTAQLTP